MRSNTPLRLAAVLALIVSIAAVPSHVGAAWRGLVPRPIDNGVYLDLFGAYERDFIRSDDRTIRWSDLFLREKVTLYSTGYFYHPRFLLYQTSLTAGFRQESYESSSLGSTGWQRGTGLEYDGRLFLLPEHSYNLELFALRYEPLLKEQSATRRNSERTSHGARFRYRRKPFFARATYAEDTARSGTTSTDVTRLGFGGRYFRHFVGGGEFSLAADHSPTKFRDSLGLSGESNETFVRGSVEAGRAALYLLGERTRRDQTGGTAATIEEERTSFDERLVVDLPLRFRSELSYRYDERDSSRSVPGEPDPRTTSETSRSLAWNLSHRLYESLDTSYRFRRNRRTSPGGESTAVSNYLTASYAKSVPTGRLLVGLNGGRLESDNGGRTEVVGEPHPATPVPGSFVLGEPDADPTSLDVRLRSPLPPFETVPLAEGAHYEVRSLGNLLEVRIFLLPPQFAIPGTYDLLVDYSLPNGGYELRTDSFGGNVSVQLLRNLVTPFYNYSTVRSEVLTGAFPSVPIDSTTNTVGVIVQRGAWRGRSEYQVLDWEVSPYRAWRSDVQYVGSVGRSTHVYANGAYAQRYYPRGSASGPSDPYSEGTWSAAGNLQKEFPDDGLVLSAGLSLSSLHGLTDTTAFSVSSSAMWKIGKLDLTVGANVYGSDTRGLDGISSERAHDYYYVKLRRKL